MYQLRQPGGGAADCLDGVSSQSSAASIYGVVVGTFFPGRPTLGGASKKLARGLLISAAALACRVFTSLLA